MGDGQNGGLADTGRIMPGLYDVWNQPLKYHLLIILLDPTHATTSAPTLHAWSGANYMDMAHSLPSCSSSAAASSLRVHVVQQGNYCARIADVASYGEVNREVSDGERCCV